MIPSLDIINEALYSFFFYVCIYSEDEVLWVTLCKNDPALPIKEP